MISGVYKISCKQNGKLYIGRSKHILRRWREHIGDLNKNQHTGKCMQVDYNKYGVEGFTFEVVKPCELDEAKKLEEELIKDYRTHIKGVGYNRQSVNFINGGVPDADDQKSRRYVHIDDDLYKSVALEAIDLEVDNGTVIDIALKLYFDMTEENKKG